MMRLCWVWLLSLGCVSVLVSGQQVVAPDDMNDFNPLQQQQEKVEEAGLEDEVDHRSLDNVPQQQHYHSHHQLHRNLEGYRPCCKYDYDKCGGREHGSGKKGDYFSYGAGKKKGDASGKKGAYSSYQRHDEEEYSFEDCLDCSACYDKPPLPPRPHPRPPPFHPPPVFPPHIPCPFPGIPIPIVLPLPFGFGGGFGGLFGGGGFGGGGCFPPFRCPPPFPFHPPPPFFGPPPFGPPPFGPPPYVHPPYYGGKKSGYGGGGGKKTGYGGGGKKTGYGGGGSSGGKKNSGGYNGGGGGKKSGGSGKKSGGSGKKGGYHKDYHFVKRENQYSLQYFCEGIAGVADDYSEELTQLVPFQVKICVQDASDVDGLMDALMDLLQNQVLVRLAQELLDCSFGGDAYEFLALLLDKTQDSELVETNDDETCYKWTGMNLMMHYFAQNRRRQLFETPEIADSALKEFLTSLFIALVNGLDLSDNPNFTSFAFTGLSASDTAPEDDGNGFTAEGLAGNAMATEPEESKRMTGAGVFLLVCAVLAVVVVGAVIIRRRRRRRNQQGEEFYVDENDHVGMNQTEDVMSETEDYHDELPSEVDIAKRPPKTPYHRKSAVEPETPVTGALCCGVGGSLPNAAASSTTNRNHKVGEPETPDAGRACCGDIFGPSGAPPAHEEEVEGRDAPGVHSSKTPGASVRRKNPNTPDAGGMCCL